MIHKLFKKEIRSLTAFFTELFAKMSKVRIHEKKIGSHKSYNFLKTNEFRLKIPFASCYLDISCLVRLKNRSRMIKRSFWVSAGPGRTVRRGNQNLFYSKCCMCSLAALKGHPCICVALSLYIIWSTVHFSIPASSFTTSM